MSRIQRRRRAESRERAYGDPTPAPQSVRATPSAPPRVRTPGRATITVARANRHLAAALPDLVQVSRKHVSTAKRQWEQEQAQPREHVPRRVTKKAALPSVEPAKSLALKQLPATCKARPTKSKGSGGSRDFVPWCSKK